MNDNLVVIKFDNCGNCDIDTDQPLLLLMNNN